MQPGGGGPVPLYMANSLSRELHLLVRRVSRLTASERSEALSALGLRAWGTGLARGGRAQDTGRRTQDGRRAPVEHGS